MQGGLVGGGGGGEGGEGGLPVEKAGGCEHQWVGVRGGEVVGGSNAWKGAGGVPEALRNAVHQWGGREGILGDLA